jgi:DNA-binding transcriptional LysR family regulator
MQVSDRIGRRLKLRDLNIFLVVANERSMSKAAARLGVTQPAVSKAIADMEYTFGAPLLDRGPRGVQPTLYGRALIKRSITIFDELRQSVTDIESLLDPATGEARIGRHPILGGRDRANHYRDADAPASADFIPVHDRWSLRAATRATRSQH